MLMASLVTERQYEEIMNTPDAWQIVDDEGEQGAQDRELRPTNSARRIKVLVEQVTGSFFDTELMLCG